MSYINKDNLIEDILDLIEDIYVGENYEFSGNIELLFNINKIIEQQEEYHTINENDIPQTQWVINPDGYYPVCNRCGDEPEGRQI